MQSNVIQVIYEDMKNYTDIEQSRKLAEILPLESADMYYPWYIEEDRDNIKSGHRISIPSVGNFIHKVNILPCWSLAALLDILPNDTSLLYFDDAYQMVYDKKPYVISNKFDNPVDACINIIEKLHELKMLDYEEK